ncbi:ATP-binding protein [Zoogloea sp.]|uniref:ATP-binding protein n=1 Tax=Zoogloea sp. TaxID=49181 RepID=UPI0031FCC516
MNDPRISRGGALAERRLWWVEADAAASAGLLRELAAGGLACAVLSGEEALASLRAGRLGVEGVVVDAAVLPRCPGLLLALRATGVPLVLLLEVEDLAVLAEGVGLGVTGVVKPASPQALRAALRLPGGEAVTPEGGTFPFRTLSEVASLSLLVAGLCPDPAAVQIALSELMINAVEHGNLGLGFNQKRELMAAGEWRNEVERLLLLPRNADRFAWLRVECRPREVRFLIRDLGAGFDPAPYLDLNAELSVEPYGRGIAIARMLAFPELVFLDGGRCVEGVSRR